MKRTTIYLDGDLELRIKTEVQRRKQPMAEFVREAVEAYLMLQPALDPPGVGAFSSGQSGTAADVDAALAETGFGGRAPAPQAKRVRRTVKRRA
jgi:hypothetical protein